TFQLADLKQATKAIHDATAAVAKKDSAPARALLGEARALIGAVPLSEPQAADSATTGAFTGSKQKGARQAELEQQWAAFAKERYAQARSKAEEALKLAK
ncbi:MAG: iron(III) transport system substrate-binding protein, partial [Variibacter sp.]|nr:iron(III) transport system substrate-binding protein [Variibacter sp.]